MKLVNRVRSLLSLVEYLIALLLVGAVVCSSFVLRLGE